jgi:glycosyltransferase involved in cell wall biosynthesis
MTSDDLVAARQDDQPPPRLSILVPVKDEAESLRQLTTEVRDTLDAGSHAGMHWELVYIDDGSRDGSWRTICELAAEDSRIKGLRLRKNFGKSAALAAGIEVASGELIATMDGDLQDDPQELPKMMARLDEGADLVVGHKLHRQDPLSKRLPSKLFNWATGVVTGLRLKDHNCGLKLGRRSVFLSTPLYGEMHRYFGAISHAQGFKVVELPVNHRARRHGSSKFGLERYVRGGLDLLTVVTLTRYHRRPLHLFGGIGMVLGVIGLLTLLYLTVLWFITDQPIGNRPLLLLGVLLVLVSMQFASVGLLAELIIHQGVRDEDTVRHVVATANTAAPSDARPAESSARLVQPPPAADGGEHEVAGRMHDAQHDRDRSRLGHSEQG